MKPHLATADDVALLDALPIAAAIFHLKDGALWVEAMNMTFAETGRLSGCTRRQFVETFKRYAAGPGGEFAQKYLNDPATAAVRDGIFARAKVSRARFLRLKLSSLASTRSAGRRCLLSVVDRTVEVRAENNLRAEMLRDSLTGLPNRLAFAEAIEHVDQQDQAGPRTRGAGRRHASLLADQREHGQPCRRRAADHLRPPADVRAARRRRAGPHGRQ